jgi:hypothetical protein
MRFSNGWQLEKTAYTLLILIGNAEISSGNLSVSLKLCKR